MSTSGTAGQQPPGGVGRVAFATAAGTAVLPVNFAMVHGAIVFRTGEGTEN